MSPIRALTIALAALALGAVNVSASESLADKRYAELNAACSAENHPYAGVAETKAKEALAAVTEKDMRNFLADCKRKPASGTRTVRVRERSSTAQCIERDAPARPDTVRCYWQ